MVKAMQGKERVSSAANGQTILHEAFKSAGAFASRQILSIPGRAGGSKGQARTAAPQKGWAASGTFKGVGGVDIYTVTDSDSS